MNDVVVHDRQKYIGGSDIGSILGINPWKSPVQLYADKIAPPSDKPERFRKVFHRGKVWEAVVAEMLTTELETLGHKVEIVDRNQRYKDPEHSMFAAEIDFEVRLDDEPDITSVELKTVHPFAANHWGESDSDEMPVWYTAQVMWGLGVAPGKRPRAILCPLFGADELRIFKVERDQPTIDGMRAAALSFWNDHVLARRPPTPQTIDDMIRLFPKNNDLRPVMIAPPDIEEAVMRLRAVGAEIKARTTEQELLQFLVMRAMRDAGTLIINDEPAVSWQTQKYSRLDQAGLKHAHPKLAKEFTLSGETRVFRLK